MILPGTPAQLINGLIAPADAEWPALAQRECDRWRAAALPGLLRIHHIGSTAVKSMPAKPVLDLLPEFGSLDALDAARAQIEGLGYQWMGEYGLPGRRYCRLDDPKTGNRTVQAHAYVQGSPEITRHLAFRDALRANASLRAAYAAVKGKCAALHPGDARGYGKCKSDWIQKVEARALAAASASGPIAPPIAPVEEPPS
ncbi:dephospho-CoA kinase/protein folding accessory domain-containing protein [Tritonibacter multivorans]|uniref:Dephospho-CoA kinase/protein folding accessory domain-containing protein n=1 Tax=Tritonibacter multivorans TaxID=928856 RepID=A0A0N7M0N5_9RHOB|nr:GrpB family protein [Tritonibacter multivorans]MDA7420798.1 GrpB family protein [Tritonibacter multivorans]CUH80961.1 dephospho-CoA kinase/protein folding accessory domain-containing protein [Tritonibacter multivorans]SFC86368.1 GrpB domain, predicted nucleotidyltransferase, UPF0157 family [Tritonibacter multivorans]